MLSNTLWPFLLSEIYFLRRCFVTWVLINVTNTLSPCTPCIGRPRHAWSFSCLSSTDAHFPAAQQVLTNGPALMVYRCMQWCHLLERSRPLFLPTVRLLSRSRVMDCRPTMAVGWTPGQGTGRWVAASRPSLRRVLARGWGVARGCGVAVANDQGWWTWLRNSWSPYSPRLCHVTCPSTGSRGCGGETSVERNSWLHAIN